MFVCKKKSKILHSLWIVFLVPVVGAIGCGEENLKQTNPNSNLETKKMEAVMNYSDVYLYKPAYAVHSCTIKLAGRFLVDGYNSLCGAYEETKENADVGYVEKAEIKGKALITGEVVQVDTCSPPFDGIALFEKAKVENDNKLIPPEYLNDNKLKLQNGENLILPAGVYYFDELKLEGHSSLGFEGFSIIFAEKVNVEGGAVLNSSEFPWNLRLIVNGEIKVEGSAKIYGSIVSLEKVKIDGQGQIFGCILAREFKGEGRGAVHCDKVLGLDSVVVYPSEVTINIDETYQLTAKAYDIRGREIECATFDWYSENPDIATVNQNGVVTGISEGDTYVMASMLGVEGKSLIHVITFLCDIIEYDVPVDPNSEYGPYILASDSKGNIWYVTDYCPLLRANSNTLGKFDPKTGDVKTWRVPGRWAVDVKVDKNDKVWIISRPYALIKFDPLTEKFTNFGVPVGSYPCTLDINNETDKIYVTIAAGRYLAEFDMITERWTKWLWVNTYPYNTYWTAGIDISPLDGSVWFLTTGGPAVLGRWDILTGQIKIWHERDNYSKGHDLEVDNQGNVWFSFHSPYLICFDPARQTFTKFEPPPPIAWFHDNFFRDSTGNIWYGRSTKVGMFDVQKHKFFECETNTYVHSVVEDPFGGIWFSEPSAGKIGKLRWK